MSMRRSPKILLLMFLAWLCFAPAAIAAETDQFTLPPTESFADLGDFMSQWHHEVLQRVVVDTNRRIMKTLRETRKAGEREKALAEVRSPTRLADEVREIFGPAMFEIDALEKRFHSKEFGAQYPGQIVAYRTDGWIYADALLLIDPRRLLFLQNPSSTIKVYGTFMGTDKIGHFHDLGHIYYKDYMKHRRAGDSAEESLARVVKEYSKGFVSEKGVVGNIVSGVYSNADLAANYAGMRFYQNLTEPVKLKGQERPPLIVRNGDFLRVNDHVQADSPWFEVFISDQFNEALNPNLHDWMMRDAVRKRIHRISPDVLRFYADPQGKSRDRQYFENLARSLMTYDGESYGHSGMRDSLIGIYNTCFDTKP